MDTSGYSVRPSKHFIMSWLRKWDWDTDALRAAIEGAYRTEKVGKHKYEAYARVKGKSRKLIFVKNEDTKQIFVITGAEGK